MRRLLIMVILALVCGACGAPPQNAATNPTTAANSTSGLAERPTIGIPTPDVAPTVADSVRGAVTIVYQVPQDGSVRGITSDGATLLLADPTNSNQTVPWALAPDGRTIAVLVLQGGDAKTGLYTSAALWTVGIDESNPTKRLELLSDFPGGDTVQQRSIVSALTNPGFQRLIWTADGNEIIVTSAHEGQVDVYAVPVAGGNPRRITNTPALELQAALAPDGTTLAYGTTDNFGTGDGWSNVGAWVQPLDGEPTSIIGANVDTWASVEIAGWLANQTAVALVRDQGVVNTAIWVREGNAEPRELYAATADVAWDIAPNRFAFTRSAVGNPKADGGLLLWDGSTAEPQLVSNAASLVHLAPQADLMLICEGDTPNEYSFTLWNAGNAASFSSGPCDDVAWSDTGVLAVGGQQANTGGWVVDGNGGVRELSIPSGARLAGWNGDDLYLFAPESGGTWQLYRLDTTRQDPPQPIGAPIAFEPYTPVVVQTP